MYWSAAIAYILQGSASEWSLSSASVGVLGACFPTGLMIGAFVWGLSGDRYGRMFAFKKTVIIASIASLILLFSVSIYMSCILLVLLGISIGGELSLGGTVFCEFCPPSKLYFLTSMALFWGIGGTVVALVAFITVLTNKTAIADWRFIVGTGAAIEFACAFFRFFLIETPAYLLYMGNTDKAEKVLNEISVQNTGKKYYFDMTLANKSEVESPKKIENKQQSAFYAIASLFKGKNLKTSICLSLVFFIQIYAIASFVYTSTLFFMPLFLKDLTLVESYGTILLQQACSMPGIFLGSRLVETRLGRRYTIFFGLLSSTLCCFLFYIENNIISVNFI
jgi:MFS transporter, putative metabolite:H+ symporter